MQGAAVTGPVTGLLNTWIQQFSPEDFPRKVDYVSRLSTLRAYLNDHVYPEIQAAALAAEVSEGRDPIYLNNHGVDHVDCVVARASRILENAGCSLTPYEGFLLLAAIYLHDVGNVFGRSDHEIRCSEILLKLRPAVADDTLENRLIIMIAAAHGGVVAKSRDTLTQLPTKYHLFSALPPPRPQFLAALLRLADELADDRTRASSLLLDLPPDKSPLGGSEAFHAYSHSLTSVDLVERDICLRFEMIRNQALRHYKKGREDVLLLDEIFGRLVKLHFERVYCIRFLRPDVMLDRIRVTIELYDDFQPDRLSTQPFRTIPLTLAESGHPGERHCSLHDLCPEELMPGGEPLTGTSLRTELERGPDE